MFLVVAKKFNPFQTFIGTVRFLICSGMRLRLNQRRTIKSLQSYDPECLNMIVRNGISTIPQWSKTVRATVPHFKPRFPVLVRVYCLCFTFCLAAEVLLSTHCQQKNTTDKGKKSINKENTAITCALQASLKFQSNTASAY